MSFTHYYRQRYNLRPSSLVARDKAPPGEEDGKLIKLRLKRGPARPIKDFAGRKALREFVYWMSTSLGTLIHLLERESYVINRRSLVPGGPRKTFSGQGCRGLLGINKLSIFIYSTVDGRKHEKWIVVQQCVGWNEVNELRSWRGVFYKEEKSKND